MPAEWQRSDQGGIPVKERCTTMSNDVLAFLLPSFQQERHLRPPVPSERSSFRIHDTVSLDQSLPEACGQQPRLTEESRRSANHAQCQNSGDSHVGLPSNCQRSERTVLRSNRQPTQHSCPLSARHGSLEELHSSSAPFSRALQVSQLFFCMVSCIWLLSYLDSWTIQVR